MSQSEQLGMFISSLNQRFMGDFSKMSFFFCHRDHKGKYPYHVIRGLHSLWFLVETTSDHPSLTMETTAQLPDTRRAPSAGWESIDFKRRIIYSHSHFHIKDIKAVNIYDYGFEILTTGPLEIVAIKNNCFDLDHSGLPPDRIDWTFRHQLNDMVAGMLGKNINPLPLFDTVSKEIKSFWRFEDDKFEEFIKNKQRNIDTEETPRVGQLRRRLLIED